MTHALECTVSAVQLDQLVFDESREESIGSAVVAVLELETPTGDRASCAAIESAWLQVCERHDVLRSYFPKARYRARFASMELFSIRCVRGHASVREGAEKVISEWAAVPVRTDTPPLARLYHIHGEQDIALMIVDHLLFDGMSVGLLRDELNDILAGRDLPPVAFGYYDFAAKQNEVIEQDAPRIAFWEESLQRTGLRQELFVPREFDEIPGADYPELLHRFRVGEAGDRAGFRRVASALRCTEYALVVSCFLSAIRSYQDHEDVGLVIATPGRSLPGTERLLGNFANCLPVGVRLGSETTMADTVRRTSSALFDALDNDIIPRAYLLRKYFPQFIHEDPTEPYLFVDLASSRAVTSALDPEGEPWMPTAGRRGEPGISAYVHLDDDVMIEMSTTPAYSTSTLDELARRVNEAWERALAESAR